MCPPVSPEPLNHFFLTKLDTVLYYHKALCRAEKLVHYLQCQGHREGICVIKIWLILLHLLKSWSVCNQNWFDNTAKMGLWKNGITVLKVKDIAKVQNVSECLDDLFWFTEHFITKFGMVMQHHKPECLAETLILYSVKVTTGVYIIKVWLFLWYLLNCWSVCNQTYFDSIAS